MSGDGKDPSKKRQDRQRNQFAVGPKFSLSLPKPDPLLTQHHAKEVRSVLQGQDIVERTPQGSQAPSEQGTAPTPKDTTAEKSAIMSVKKWMKERPIDVPAPAPPMIQYPRMWASRRGRYCKFKAPGAGTYGLIRARPTY
jgi:hypothetical protein